MTKIKKNIIIVLLSVLLIFGGILLWALFQKGKLGKEEIKIPPQKEETINEVLERLTPSEAKPLTEKERKEQEKLLQQLTPAKPKPMTEKEQKELEELLKKLTPK